MSNTRFPMQLLPVNRRQWLAVCVVTVIVLAHLALIDWAKDSLALIQSLDDDEETVVVELHESQPTLPKAAPIPPPAPPIHPTAPPPVAPKAPEPPSSGEPAAAANVPADTSQAPVTAGTAPTPAPDVSPSVAPASTIEAALNPQAAAVETQAANAAPPSPEKTVLNRVSFPPSADLSYDALAMQGSRQLSGSGNIIWQQNGQSYSIKGEASALLLTLLSYQSTGQLGNEGLLPDVYHEKRIGKSSTSTHFVRERKAISFSASTKIYEIQGGEQDRGSVIWQLAGLARGDPDKLTPGLAFDAVVVGTKAADRWNVRVIGNESLVLAGSQVSSWHLALAPTESNFDYQIDLWLSPERDWYPSKIMYTNRNGATLTLLLAKLVRK